MVMCYTSNHQEFTTLLKCLLYIDVYKRSMAITTTMNAYRHFIFHVKSYRNIYIIDTQVMVVSCSRIIYAFVLLLNFCKAMPYMRKYLWRIHTVVFSYRPCSCSGLVDGWDSCGFPFWFPPTLLLVKGMVSK